MKEKIRFLLKLTLDILDVTRQEMEQWSDEATQEELRRAQEFQQVSKSFDTRYMYVVDLYTNQEKF